MLVRIAGSQMPFCFHTWFAGQKIYMDHLVTLVLSRTFIYLEIIILGQCIFLPEIQLIVLKFSQVSCPFRTKSNTPFPLKPTNREKKSYLDAYFIILIFSIVEFGCLDLRFCKVYWWLSMPLFSQYNYYNHFMRIWLFY